MLTIRNISGGGDQQLLSADDGKLLAIDATSGNTHLVVPSTSGLSIGWHVPWIHKIDPTSNIVGIKVTEPGVTLNHFWDKDAPYPLLMNLTQQACELVYLGDGKFSLAGKSFHRNVPQSQRTFVSVAGVKDSFNVTPQEINEIIEINASSTDMGIYFDPVQSFTRGGYMSAVVEFVRMDSSSHNCRIFAASGEGINGAAYFDLNGIYNRARCYIDSARITKI